MSIVTLLRRYQGYPHQKRALEGLFSSIDEKLRLEIKEAFKVSKSVESENIELSPHTFGNYISVSMNNPLTVDQAQVLHQLNQVNGKVKEIFEKSYKKKPKEVSNPWFTPEGLQYCCGKDLNFTILATKLNNAIYQLDKLDFKSGTKLSDNQLNIISHFMASCIHQSGGLVNILDAKFPSPSLDLVKYRGAGFIRVEGRSNYLNLARHLEDSRIYDEGALYVSKNYPWLSSVFVWNQLKLSDAAIAGDVTKILNKLKMSEKFYYTQYQKKVLIYLSNHG